jgi:hypothetical protein
LFRHAELDPASIPPLAGLKLLDSGFRRNDEAGRALYFYG